MSEAPCLWTVQSQQLALRCKKPAQPGTHPALRTDSSADHTGSAVTVPRSLFDVAPKGVCTVHDLEVAKLHGDLASQHVLLGDKVADVNLDGSEDRVGVHESFQNCWERKNRLVGEAWYGKMTATSLRWPLPNERQLKNRQACST